MAKFLGLPTTLGRAYSAAEQAVLDRLNKENDRKHNNLQRRLKRQKDKNIIPSETQKALNELTHIKGRSKSETIAIAREKERLLNKLAADYDKSYKTAKIKKEKEISTLRVEMRRKTQRVKRTLENRITEGVLIKEAQKGISELDEINAIQLNNEKDYKLKVEKLEALKDKIEISKEDVLKKLHKENKVIYSILDKDVVITDEQIRTFWSEYEKLKQVIGSDPDFFRYKELSEAIIKVIGETGVNDETFQDFDSLVASIKDEYEKQIKTLEESPDLNDEWWNNNPLNW